MGDQLTSIEVAGIKGCYTDQGAGRTIVLLASPFARISIYRPTIKALAASHRVIAIELPGSGCAAHLSRGWNFNQYADWVLGLLENLNLQGAILIGHSNSAAIALKVAARAPARLAAVVLADMVGASGPQSVLAVLVGCAICIPLELRFVTAVIAPTLYNMRHHTRNFITQFWRSIKADLRADAARVRLPALIAWGAHDYVMPPDGAAELRKLIPHSQLHLSRQGSHDWIIEHPREFALAVQGFAAQQSEPISPP